MAINQATGQPDPTNTSPVNYTVVFSETVTGSTNADIQLTGTAGATTATVTGATYNVAISGMTSNGTVRATLPAGGAQDAAWNTNTASPAPTTPSPTTPPRPVRPQHWDTPTAWLGRVTR